MLLCYNSSSESLH
uniref:Uncharacterized protein n=1 Tax=Rhizophora mucronata TaxID=61149 RepID=A0A2P2N808_RHIMU